MQSNKQTIRKAIRSILTESDNLLYTCQKHNALYYELQGAATTISEITRGKLLVFDVKLTEDISKMSIKVMVNGNECSMKSCGNSIFELTELEMSGTTHQLAKAINGNATVAIACNEHYKFKNQ